MQPGPGHAGERGLAGRVTTGKLAVEHRIAFLAYGVAYEAAALETGERFHAITPMLGARYAGFELDVDYRFVVAGETMTTPRDRFSLALLRHL